MVTKISVGNSLRGALEYNGQKVNEGEGKVLASNKIFDNGTGTMDINRDTIHREYIIAIELYFKKSLLMNSACSLVRY